jgi:protein-L-isoaspartate O-methyltransferase
VKKVLFDASMNARKMLHGDTIHGVESVETGKSGVPLSYYHPTGPAGDVMKMMEDRPNQNVGIIGLGTGSLAAYANSSRHITFFEIDPQMMGIAQSFFTYLRRCAGNCTVVLGDGRLKVAEAPPGQFDLLVIDAFSSDSIPAHLVSREAVALYVSRLKSGGVLLFHVSNRYLDVQSLVRAVLIQAGLATFTRHDADHSVPGKSASDYVVGAQDAAALGSIQTNPGWQRVASASDLRPWTDDYSNVLSLVHVGGVPGK